MPITIFFPSNITATVNITPAIPNKIPINMVTPSLLSMPKDRVKIPKAGTKFVNGKGSAIETAKIIQKKPIIFVPLSDAKNNNLGFNNLSIFFSKGEDLITMKLKVLLFTDNLVNHFGSHGELKPSSI